MVNDIAQKLNGSNLTPTHNNPTVATDENSGRESEVSNTNSAGESGDQPVIKFKSRPSRSETLREILDQRIKKRVKDMDFEI